MFGNWDRYLAAFLTALVVTYLLTPLVRELACRFGVVDLPMNAGCTNIPRPAAAAWLWFWG